MERAAAKEHAEYFLRVHLLLKPVVAEAARIVPLRLAVSRLLSGHIVDLTFLGICQTGVSS